MSLRDASATLDRGDGSAHDIRRERVACNLPWRTRHHLPCGQLLGRDQPAHGRRTDVEGPRRFLEGEVLVRLRAITRRNAVIAGMMASDDCFRPHRRGAMASSFRSHVSSPCRLSTSRLSP